jgi:hypothetical protein
MLPDIRPLAHTPKHICFWMTVITTSFLGHLSIPIVYEANEGSRWYHKDN